MIDIKRAKQAFKDYVKNYNPEDEKIRLKIAHIERTSQMAKKIARKSRITGRRYTVGRTNWIIT